MTVKEHHEKKASFEKKSDYKYISTQMYAFA